jgi:glycosyltransferase 2 family protein
MALPDAAPSRPRTAWIRALRLVVSVGLLVLLVTKIDFQDLVPGNRSLPGTLAFLLAGIALMTGSIVLAAWRWQKVLEAFEVTVPLRQLVSHYFAGQFVGNVLPSTVGGDVLRVSRVARDVGARDTAFASVVIERLTGFVALPLLVLVGFLIRPDLFGESNAWIALTAAAGTVVILGVILFVAGHPSLAGRFKDHENWMRYIGAVHVGVDRLRRAPRDAGTVLAAAVAYQLVVVASVYCAVHTIGLLTIPNGAVLAYVPAVAIVQVLPISVGGLGIREGLLALLFHPLGAETGQAVGVGLLWYALMLISSLPGAPAFAIGHRHRVPVGGEA